MPASAAAGAPASGGGGGGGNPFQLATNLYCEKNNTAVLTSTSLTTSQQQQGGQVNAGQYLRGIRLIVRAQSASSSVSTFAATVSDWPWNLLTQIDLVNVDGREILYVMGGYAHYLAQKYGRPWLGDPMQYPDAAAATNLAPQFTLSLQPEIRWTAGVLANTDTRSQYRFDYTLESLGNINSANGGSYNSASAPVVSVTPYLDAYAQPDAEDLQGTPNQPVPPGLNLQFKRRHQIFTMNAGGVGQHFPVGADRQRAPQPDLRHPQRRVGPLRGIDRPDPVADRQPVARQDQRERGFRYRHHLHLRCQRR